MLNPWHKVWAACVLLWALGAGCAAADAAWSPGERIMISVETDGMVYLSVEQIREMGLDPESADWDRMNLRHFGAIRPIQILRDAGGRPDGLVFRGEYPKEQPGLDVRSSTRRQNVYELVLNDADPPVRYREPERAGPAEGAPDGTIQRRFEENQLLLDGRKFPDYPTDYVMWGTFTHPRMNTKPAELAPLPDVWAEDHASSIGISLWGNSRTALGHDWTVAVNGHEVGRAVWHGLDHHEFRASFPSRYLNRDAPNQVDLISNREDPGAIDSIFLDSITLTYRPQMDSLVANQYYGIADGRGALKAAPAAGGSVPTLYCESLGLAIPLDRSRPLTGLREGFVVAGRDDWLRPARLKRIERTRPILAEAAAPLDLVMITHRDFMGPARALKAYRQGQGLGVLLVDVADIYDQYNHGNFGAEAIRAFMDDVIGQGLLRTGRTAGLFLIGDATSDYLGIRGGTYNYVPTYRNRAQEYHHEDWWPAFSHDDYFAYGDTGGFEPQLAVGRFPCNTPETLFHYIEKIRQYESADPEAAWQRRATLIASDGWAGYAERFERTLGGMDCRVIVSRGDQPDAEELDELDIRQAFDEGTGLVYYVGHGSHGMWANYWGKRGPSSREYAYMFSAHQIARMENRGKYPIVMASTCFTTYFDLPQGRTRYARLHKLAENGLGVFFVEAEDKGAIAVLGHTGKVSPITSDAFFRTFYQALGREGSETIGEAFMAAKRRHQARQFHGIGLIGDPVLRVGQQFHTSQKAD